MRGKASCAYQVFRAVRAIVELRRHPFGYKLFIESKFRKLFESNPPAIHASN